MTGLPSWGRAIVGIFAIPGLVMLALSMVAIVVSLLALLLLTVPVYSVLRRLLVAETVEGSPSPVKRVEATVVE